jgi:hypothetical protein
LANAAGKVEPRKQVGVVSEFLDIAGFSEDLHEPHPRQATQLPHRRAWLLGNI